MLGLWVPSKGGLIACKGAPNPLRLSNITVNLDVGVGVGATLIVAEHVNGNTTVTSTSRSSSGSAPRIEPVPQNITGAIRRKYRDGDGPARDQRDVRKAQEHRASLIE
jgi:hypothetical protein